MTTYDYDLFVIGAGSGGVRAARIAAGHGARVAIAEEYRVGGTCVIRGCVPKKLFVYASHFSQEFEAAKGFGWNPGEATFDWQTLVRNKDREIDRLNAAYIRNLAASGAELVMSRATVTGPNSVRLEEDQREVSARYILVATGSSPFVPDIPGAEHAVTSNEMFHLEALPRHATIVGAGYIGVEFACILNGLGVDVSLLQRSEEILTGFDDDLRSALREEMVKKGIDVRVACNVDAIETLDGRKRILLHNGDRVETDLVMYATGRRPNVEGLGLEAAGVKLGWAGQVMVDEYSRTNVESIYAVGDVTDRKALTPVAIREGEAFADTVFAGRPTAVDYDNIPTAIFSQPEIGTVGLTEAAAREHHGEITVYRSSFRPMKHTLSGIDERMMMKLIVDTATDQVIGCHILGEGAGEMAQTVAIAVRMGATKADFDATMALHPTAGEELVTMRTPVSA